MTASIDTLIPLLNTSSDEQHRIACYKRWRLRAYFDYWSKWRPAPPSDRDVAENRSKNGLGHLNRSVPLLTSRLRQVAKEYFNLSYKPVAKSYHSVEFKVGVQDVLVKSTHRNTSYKHKGGGKRGVITEFSRGSRQRLKTHIRNTETSHLTAFLTLTYPADYSSDGVRVKRDLDVMKKWLKRHGVDSGVWFLEFQKRGAPHFHAFLPRFPVGGASAVARHWYKVVGSGDRKHLEWHLGRLSGRPCLELMRNEHAASAYATKYAAKDEQKDVPDDYRNVGRFWGYWGAARPVWRYFSGGGVYSRDAAKKALLSWRSRFSDAEGLDKWSGRAYISCVMWGGASVLDDLLRSVNWTPF